MVEKGADGKKVKIVPFGPQTGPHLIQIVNGEKSTCMTQCKWDKKNRKAKGVPKKIPISCEPVKDHQGGTCKLATLLYTWAYEKSARILKSSRILKIFKNFKYLQKF